MVCTKLVIPGDTLALPIGGKKKNLTRRSWLDLAEYCGLPEKAAKRIIDDQIKALAPSLKAISQSFLPEEMKSEFKGTIEETTDILGGLSRSVSLDEGRKGYRT